VSRTGNDLDRRHSARVFLDTPIKPQNWSGVYATSALIASNRSPCSTALAPLSVCLLSVSCALFLSAIQGCVKRQIQKK